MRFLFLVAFIMLVFSGSMAWKRWQDSNPADPPSTYRGPVDLVALPDGATMIAVKGTITRSLVDWLGDRASKSEAFELGGEEFVGRTAEPTSESLGRVPRLAAMLRAYPDIDLVAIGHASASGDPKQDGALAVARAQRLVKLLVQRGIVTNRLRAESQGSKAPLPGTDPTSPHNERVSIVLKRGK